MESVPKDEFVRWAAGVGIGFDTHYPGWPMREPPLRHARFWVLPYHPGAWPHFAATLLSGLDEWAAGFLWPRSGAWPTSRPSPWPDEGVFNVVLRGAGIPDGWAGPVRCARNDEPALLAVLFAAMAFGGCVDDDLFFIPDHGRQLLQTSHHDVIHVYCADEARVLELVKHMEQGGYPLPTEPPDATFIWPAWMPQHSE